MTFTTLDLLQYTLKCMVHSTYRSLGVSNFGIQHLEALSRLGLEKPSVNQIQIHPWHQNKDIVKYCRERDITVIGYSPLAKAKRMNDTILLEIARKSAKFFDALYCKIFYSYRCLDYRKLLRKS